MRFPVNATRQKRCPVCRTLGPGTNSPVTPRPETASLSLSVLHQAARKQPGSVFLGGHLFLGWDSGLSKHRSSRTTLGASVRVAQLQARSVNDGLLQLQFCSIACLRQFLLMALDELERRAQSLGPQVQTARKQAEA